MTESATPAPAGYHAVTPYLVVTGADRLVDFLRGVFDATELRRDSRPDGTIRHAEVRIGDSVLMLAEAAGEWRAMPTMLYVYVADTDATYRRALDAGATSIEEPGDKDYGDRNAGVRDSSGNLWWIATPVRAATA